MPCYPWANAYLGYNIEPPLTSIGAIFVFSMKRLVSNVHRHALLHVSSAYACSASKTYIKPTCVDAYVIHTGIYHIRVLSWRLSRHLTFHAFTSKPLPSTYTNHLTLTRIYTYMMHAFAYLF